MLELGYTPRAIAISKLESYDSPTEMASLFKKVRTFDELRRFIPSI